MRLEELHLQDFQGFSKLDLDFSKAGNLVVLAGKNGAGKSTVLRSVSTFLGRFIACMHDPAASLMNLLSSWHLRHGSECVNASVTYSVDTPPGFRLTDALSFRAQGMNPYDDELGRYAREHLAPLATDKNASVPLLFHYGAEGSFPLRGHGQNNPREPAEDAPIPPQARAYSVSFEPDSVGQFQYFLKWFRMQEDIENQTRLRRDNSFRNRHLSAVRTAIERFLGALPGNASFRNLRVEREAVEEESAVFKVAERVSYVIDKDSGTFDLDQLSDGERSTLLIVADIAMRLVIANPAAENPLHGTGIVLIDEIERHLHPAWQRAILGALGANFPNCQFIVTTHSPQVLSTAPRESVFLLEHFQLVDVPPHTYGRDSNAILEEVMGVSERPEQALAKIQEIGRLLDAEEIKAARQKLAELSTWLGEGDAEITRLRRMIDFLV